MRRVLCSAALLLALSACSPPQKKELTGLRTFSYLGGDVRGGSVAYTISPPAGGPYNAFWQTCGAYTAPLYNEYAVHSLARGALWATYQPGLDAAQLEKLRTLLNTTVETGEGDQKKTVKVAWLLSPREHLPAPIVLSAWNAQITADTADDERLKQFVALYGAGSQAPEAGASCANGFGETR